MLKLPFVLAFILLTVVSWGNYGPLMHEGQAEMGDALRPFIGVGFAYFLIAVVVPVLLLRSRGERGHWSLGGTVLSLLAGSVGAVGALGVIMAFTFKGEAVYVMPLVFGGAPIVSTIVTMALTGTFRQVNAIFLLGVLTASIGAAGVLRFRPGAEPPAAQAEAAVGEELRESAAERGEQPERNYPLIIASIVAAMCCWGSYGPVLHKGQMKMGGSRMRPFLCVGIAYFAIAVAAPFAALQVMETDGHWNLPGTLWSLAGGTAGAFGALGIVMAFNFGGRPIFVMPLVFGLAPVMNTITTVTGAGAWDRIGLPFIVALIMVITGAVTVLVFAPKPKPANPPAGDASAKPQPA